MTYIPHTNLETKQMGNKKDNMKIIAALAGILLLGGCATATPAATVTVTATSNATQDLGPGLGMTDREEFVYLLESVGVSSLFTTDPDIVSSLINIALTTCDGIADGMSKEDISLALYLAMEETNGGDDMNFAAMAAAAAATIVYCPQYQGFWD